MADDIIYFKVHGTTVKPAHRIPGNGSVEVHNTYSTAYVIGFSQAPATVTPGDLTSTGNNYEVPGNSVATFTFTNGTGSDLDVDYGMGLVGGSITGVPTPGLGHTIVVTKSGGTGLD
jgi:hypothetical protein